MTPKMNPRDAFESGLRLARAAAAGKADTLAQWSNLLRELGINPGEFMALSQGDISAEQVKYLEEWAQGINPSSRNLGAWLLVGFYTVYLFSRDDAVANDPPLAGTLKNAFGHMMDAYGEWLARSALSDPAVGKITGLMKARFGASSTNKGDVLTNLLESLREEAERQVAQREMVHNGGIPNNPWISGSFYLVAVLVVLVGIAVAGHYLSIFALPAVLIGGLLLVITVGILQLRNDDRLAEKRFGELIAQVLKRLPLLSRTRSIKR